MSFNINNNWIQMYKVISLILISTVLYATNGTNLTGTSALQRSLGGTGIAHAFNSSSIGAINPAILTRVKSDNLFSADITYFSPSVSSMGSESEFEASFIPAISWVHRDREEWVYSMNIFGSSGMGVDYTNSSDANKKMIKSSLQTLKIIPAIGYKDNDRLSIGFAPVIMYGRMGLNYADSMDEDSNPIQSDRFVSEDMGFGYQLGIVYSMSDKLDIAMTYNSSLSMKYEEVANFNQFGFDGKVANFVMMNNINVSDGISEDELRLISNGVRQQVQGVEVINSLNQFQVTQENLDTLCLEQPAEYTIGASFQKSDKALLLYEMKKIKWSGAKGYSEMGWIDQNVFSVGAEWKLKKLDLRAGFNYASSPLKDNKNSSEDSTVNLFGVEVYERNIDFLNIIAFPAISQTHISGGVGFKVWKTWNMDIAYVYSPESKITQSGMSSSMSQNSFSVGINHTW